MPSELRSRVVEASAIGEELRRRMFGLFETYYDAVNYGTFSKDLAEKRCVLLLEDSKGGLQGFTTVQVLDADFDGKSARALFSGDTIIHHEYRGEQTLPLAWFRLVGQIRAEKPEQRLFWFLIVKGDKTYRYLPAFFREYYPTRKGPTPEPHRRLMRELATRKFGENYDDASGVVRFASSLGHLKPKWAEPKSGAEEKPDVRFFLERNPGYREGHELVCLAELHEDNMRSLGRKSLLG
jgi:hypothetical protein